MQIKVGEQRGERVLEIIREKYTKTVEKHKSQMDFKKSQILHTYAGVVNLCNNMSSVWRPHRFQWSSVGGSMISMYK